MTDERKSKYNITGLMNIDDDIQRKTDEFLELIKPIPKQLIALKKIARKEAIKEQKYKRDVEKT